MPVYVYRDGQMVNKATGEPMNTGDWKPVVPMVDTPMQGYESPMDGTWISDRKQERDHMKQHNVAHAADDKSRPSGFKNRKFVEKRGLWDKAQL